MSVYGGKLTTYRRLAEDVVDRLVRALDHDGRPWTERAHLPGGDLPGADFARFLAGLEARYPQFDALLLRRYARAYGTRAERLLDGATRSSDLGVEVLPGLHAREIEYLRREEFALNAEDILYRRSKLGVHLAAGSTARLDDWLATH
jgi:glycerol-3-phosphate dehydrogenase